MESILRLHSIFALFAIVLGASRSQPKMNGVINDASEITWAHAVNSWDALEKALSGSVDFLEADISLGNVVGNEGLLPIPIMAHPPETTSDISLDSWLSTVAARRPDKGIKLDFKSLEVLEPSLVLLKKYSSKLNGSIWLSADVLSGPVHPKAEPLRSDYFFALASKYLPSATISLGWTTYWIRRFPINTWMYEWKHVRQMADAIRCWYKSRKYPPIVFSVRALFVSRSIKQLQWLLETIPHSSLLVWSASGDRVNSEDFSRIQKYFSADKVFFNIPRTLYKPRSKLKMKNTSKKKYIKDDSKWVSVADSKENTCEAFTYTDNTFILFGRPTNSAVLQRNLFPIDANRNFTLTGRVKFFPGENMLNPSHWEHKLKLVLSNVERLPKHAVSHSKKKRVFSVREPDVLWSAVNMSVLYTFEHPYFQTNTACRMFKLDINSNLYFDAWTIPCDSTYEDISDEEVSKNSISEISLKETLDEEGLFMVGFHSYGEEYVLVYDLNIVEKEDEIELISDFPQLNLPFVSYSFTIKGKLSLILDLMLMIFLSWRYLS